MSVNSISGSSIWSSQPTAAAAKTGGATQSSAATSDGQADRFDTALADQGISGTKLTDLRNQIDTAVQSAKSSDSDVKSAVDGVLQKNGIDVSQFKQNVGGAGGARGAHGGHHHHKKAADGDSDDATDASTDLTTNTASSPNSATQALQSLLSGTGLDANSVQSSLTALLNGSSSDTTSLFSGAAVGSSLDVAA